MTLQRLGIAACVLSLAALGATQRSQTAFRAPYRNDGQALEQYTDVQLDGAGNVYAIAGIERGTDWQLVLSKYTPSGSVLWHRVWQEAGRDISPGAFDVRPDGRVVVLADRAAGSANYPQLRVYDPNGGTVWTCALPQSDGGGGQVAWAPNGEVGYLCFTRSAPRFGVVSGSNGAVRWNRNGTNRSAGFLDFDSANRLVIGGSQGTSDTSLFVERYDQAGPRVADTVMNPTPNVDYVSAMFVDLTGCVFLASTEVNPGGTTPNCHFIKLKADNSLEWEEPFGPGPGRTFQARKIVASPNGSMLIYGVSIYGEQGFESIFKGSFFGGPIAKIAEQPVYVDVFFEGTADIEVGRFGESYTASLSVGGRLLVRNYSPYGQMLWEHVLEETTPLPMLAVDRDGQAFVATGAIGVGGNGTDPTLFKVIQAPTAMPDLYAVNQNGTLSVSLPAQGVLANDRYATSARMLLVSGPGNGTLSFAENGTFTYRPNNGFRGTDSFRYRVDRNGMGTDATVTVRVQHSVLDVSVGGLNVPGGVNRVGTVTLTGPAPTGNTIVALRTTGPLGTAANMAVPAGQSVGSFDFYTNPVGVNTPATIEASFEGRFVRKNLMITVASLRNFGVTYSVPGGLDAEGDIQLDGMFTIDVNVGIASSNTAVAQVPTQVRIPARANSWGFTFTTRPVVSETQATITATYGGVSRSAIIRVLPSRVISWVIDPLVIRGGSQAAGIIKMTGPAPTGGLSMTMSDNSTYTSVPGTINIPAGGGGANFIVYTAATTVTRTSQITLTFNGQSWTQTVTITP